MALKLDRGQAANTSLSMLGVGWALFIAHQRIDRRRRLLGWFALLLPPIALAGLAFFIRERGYVVTQEPSYGYLAFLLTGLIGWQIFTDAIDAPVRVLSRYRHQIRSTLVEHKPLFIAALLQTLMNACIRVAMLLVVLAVITTIQITSVLAFFGMLPLVMLGFGIGMLIAPHALVHEDISQILPYGLTFLMFLVPVFYPISAWSLTALAPLASALELLRALSLALPPPPNAVLATATAALGICISWAVYRVWRPHMVARLS